MTVAEKSPVTPDVETLRRELEDLRSRNRELEQTLDAIRSGEVDAIVVSRGESSQVYALEGADHPYRVLVENIQEGALTLTTTGMVLYANAAFAAMRGLPVSAILGTSLADHLTPGDRAKVDALLEASRTGAGRGEMSVCSGTATIPVLVSMTPLVVNDETKVSVVVTDRRQDYGRLRLQGRMLDSVADAVTAADPDGTIIYWNRAAERLYGRTAAEMVGRPMADATEFGVTEGEARQVFAELSAGLIWSGESMARHRDGHRFPVLATRAPVYDENGTLVAVIATSRDISERKEAEEAITAAQRQLQSIIDNTPAIVYAFDLDERFVLVNTTVAELFDSTPDQMIGKRRHAFMPREDADWHEANDRKVIEAGHALEFEEFSQLPGRSITWLTTKFPLCDPQGRIYAVAGISADITERKRAEEALREAEERYRFALDAARFGTFDLRVATGEVLWDERLKAVWGLAADEDLDFASVVDRVHPDDRERVQQIFAAALAPDSDGTYEADYRIVLPDGSVRWTSAQGCVHFQEKDGSRTAVRVVGIEHDITERKEAEAALHEYAERLRTSNEELQRFAYVASHDLQEPLRSIVSFSQLLERRYKGKLDTDADEFIAFIVEGGTRMQALIQDLLQVSRVETGGKPLEPTDVGEVANGALRALEAPIREAGAIVTVEPLPAVMADASQLEQVFMNLVGNALKYRRDDVRPEIRISAERAGPMVQFAVQDNGIGIEAEYFDRIFEMFRRLHTHDEYGGTGIGLAVVKKIVDRHGGKVWVESKPGAGSTFLFTLPAA